VRYDGEHFTLPLPDGPGKALTLTAGATALVVAHPVVVTGGVRALAADPTLYASAEAHPTVTRAARLAEAVTCRVNRVVAVRKLALLAAAMAIMLADDESAALRITLYWIRTLHGLGGALRCVA
jgi:hypothetical protein